MKVRLALSGGFGGLRIEGRVDTSELSEETSRKVEKALDAERLAELDGARGSPLMMDSQQYELTVMPEEPGGEARRYLLDDSALPDDLIEALDVLREALTPGPSPKGRGE